MAIGDNKGYTRILLDSYSTTVTGWGVYLRTSLLDAGLFGLDLILRVRDKGTLSLKPPEALNPKP